MSDLNQSESEYGSDHGTIKSYVVGFVLSIVITVLAFLLVAFKPVSSEIIYIVIAILAILQLYVQLVFFLHLNTRSEGRWNLLVFLFSLIVVLIIIFGSIWIMVNLNYNMVH